MSNTFEAAFATLTGNAPFPWQRALYDRLVVGEIPASCDIPTGLGKTSVVVIWLLARLAGAAIPTRLVYVVNRRTVVDQTTAEIERLRTNLGAAGISEPLALSTLRGQLADNRAWSADPSQLAVVCGTVDMIGSRLLFSGYRVGYRTRPLHAGFLGQDALIVHDEAHLEPAFQHLIESIAAEQRRCKDGRPLRVMALTATSRSTEVSFGIGKDDLAHPVVSRRVHAVKKLILRQHAPKALVEEIFRVAMSFRDARRAVLVFVRTVDELSSVVSRLRRAGAKVQQLTGTMRGFERDLLVKEDPIVQRFLPHDVAHTGGDEESVYFVCTSAGEVGINLSADHLVCDLATFDSMAQRLGRLNRFGLRDDSEIHVIHPDPEDLDVDNPMDLRRHRTLALLRALDGNASAAALGGLEAEARREAFAPEPTIVNTSEILFDAWSMTTIRAPLPGRPSVAAYLHGKAEWEPPTTHVAWRDEVDLISGDLLLRYRPDDLLEDCPLKPHEVLPDRTSRVVETLEKLAATNEKRRLAPVWVIDQGGLVQATTLARLLADPSRLDHDQLADCTLILSPTHCPPVDGHLSVDIPDDGRSRGDVADEWYGEGGEPLRRRVFNDEPAPSGMRLVRRLRLLEDDAVDEDDTTAAEEERARRATWSWFESTRGASDEGTRTNAKPVLLDVHSSDVEREASRIAARLPLAPQLRHAIVVAARLHDIGKVRRVWQRSIGNSAPDLVLAKSGGTMRTLELTDYRHELGSVIDAERNGLLDELEPAERELALHLVAAHHGRARPHFPPKEMFDPDAGPADMNALAAQIADRFANLQRRFGRWGLAYLESIVRAADYAASAAPSSTLEEI